MIAGPEVIPIATSPCGVWNAGFCQDHDAAEVPWLAFPSDVISREGDYSGRKSSLSILTACAAPEGRSAKDGYDSHLTVTLCNLSSIV